MFLLYTISKSLVLYFITQSFMPNDQQSSDKVNDSLQKVDHHKCQNFRTKRKFLNTSQQKRVLVEASRKELVPGVDRGFLWLVHQDELLSQAQSAGVVACSEG